MKQNALVAQGMQTFLKRYKNLTEYGQFHNARLSIVHFIALGGCLEEVSRVHKVDTCAEDGEFPSMLCQLVEDANQHQEEKQNSHQEDPRAFQLQGTQFLAVQYPTASKLLERARLHSLKDSIQQGTQNGGKW